MATIVEKESVTQGGTEDLVFTLDRDEQAVNLTGATVVLMRTNMTSQAKDEFSTDDPSPKLTIDDAIRGILRFSPDAAVWPTAGVKYRIFFRVTTVSGDVIDFPSLGCIEVTVTKHC